LQGEPVESISVAEKRVDLKSKLYELVRQGKFSDAAVLVMGADKSLECRDEDTIDCFKQAKAANDESPSPIAVYLHTLVSTTGIHLNTLETIELARLAIITGNKDVFEERLRANRLQSSEELGDFLLENGALHTAVIVYMTTHIPDKVLNALLMGGMYRGIIRYVQLSGYPVEYADILARFKKLHSLQLTLEFALSLAFPDTNTQPLLDPHKVCRVLGIEECGQESLLKILKDKLLMESSAEHTTNELGEEN